MINDITNTEDVEFTETPLTQPPGWNDTSAPWPFTDNDIVKDEETNESE